MGMIVFAKVQQKGIGVAHSVIPYVLQLYFHEKINIAGGIMFTSS
jgi:hypothetical protein